MARAVLRGWGSTPHTLLGSGGMRLWAVPWCHALLWHVLRRRLLHQSRLLCVGHPVGVIRTQIPAVTRLAKGHPDGSCARHPGWRTPRKQDQRLGPRCRTTEVYPRRHLICQRLHGSARRVDTQRQFLKEVFGGCIRGRQGIAIDGQALPWFHVSVLLWHALGHALAGVSLPWTGRTRQAEPRGGGHRGLAVQGNHPVPMASPSWSVHRSPCAMPHAPGWTWETCTPRWVRAAPRAMCCGDLEVPDTPFGHAHTGSLGLGRRLSCAALTTC